MQRLFDWTVGILLATVSLVTGVVALVSTFVMWVVAAGAMVLAFGVPLIIILLLLMLLQ